MKQQTLIIIRCERRGKRGRMINHRGQARTKKNRANSRACEIIELTPTSQQESRSNTNICIFLCANIELLSCSFSWFWFEILVFVFPELISWEKQSPKKEALTATTKWSKFSSLGKLGKATTASKWVVVGGKLHSMTSQFYSPAFSCSNFPHFHVAGGENIIAQMNHLRRWGGKSVSLLLLGQVHSMIQWWRCTQSFSLRTWSNNAGQMVNHCHSSRPLAWISGSPVSRLVSLKRRGAIFVTC